MNITSLTLTAPPASPMQPPPDKEVATLQARAALRGIAVDQVDDHGVPTWLLQRWGLSRQVASLKEARTLLRDMGVQS